MGSLERSSYYSFVFKGQTLCQCDVRDFIGTKMRRRGGAFCLQGADSLIFGSRKPLEYRTFFESKLGSSWTGGLRQLSGIDTVAAGTARYTGGDTMCGGRAVF